MEPTEAAARLAFMTTDAAERSALIATVVASNETPREGLRYMGEVAGHLIGIIDALAARHPDATTIAHELTVSYEIDDFARGMAEATDLPPIERNDHEV